MKFNPNSVKNKVQCGYLDNIVYDFVGGHLPFDDLNKDLSLFNGLTWSEMAKIRYWYNKALQDGNQSVSHLKLVYVVAEIVKKYYKNAKFCNQALTDTPKFW